MKWLQEQSKSTFQNSLKNQKETGESSSSPSGQGMRWLREETERDASQSGLVGRQLWESSSGRPSNPGWQMTPKQVRNTFASQESPSLLALAQIQPTKGRGAPERRCFSLFWFCLSSHSEKPRFPPVGQASPGQGWPITPCPWPAALPRGTQDPRRPQCSLGCWPSFPSCLKSTSWERKFGYLKQRPMKLGVGKAGLVEEGLAAAMAAAAGSSSRTLLLPQQHQESARAGLLGCKWFPGRQQQCVAALSAKAQQLRRGLAGQQVFLAQGQALGRKVPRRRSSKAGRRAG